MPADDLPRPSHQQDAPGDAVLPGSSHIGVWRAAVALPAIVASALLLVVGFGWAGRWEGLILFGWFSCGLLTLTRRGEQITVRVACGFRRATQEEDAALATVWSPLLAACAIPADSVDLFVQHSEAVNAYAVGSRSVAVTTRILREHSAGRLDDELLAAVLAHELGHCVTARVRFGPATAWLALPWRSAYRLTLRFASRLAGPQPRIPLLLVVVAAMSIAIVQSAQQHDWSNTTVLAALAVFSVASPVADAALSRAGERAADRYAAQHGHGRALAQMLVVLHSTRPADTRRFNLLDTHPRHRRRVKSLIDQSLHHGQAEAPDQRAA